jgi:CBS domain containing-hemolysin-like protein
VAVTLFAAAVLVAASLWAALLTLGDEAAAGDITHTLGAAPARSVTAVPLHRRLYVARLALLVVAAAAAGVASGWWLRPTLEATGVTLAAIGLVFVVGDALPRALATLSPEIASAALPLARGTLPPLAPFFWLLGWLDRGLHDLVGGDPLKPELGPSQRDMLLGVFSLGDTTVAEVMTPRLDITGVDTSLTADAVLDVFRASGYSRLVAYEGTLDNVVGILFAKDVLARHNDRPGSRWQELVQPAGYVPETKTLDAELRDFLRGPAHLDIVVDEFGGTSGLITLEDILEEIVGEIHDEYDGEAEPLIRQEGGRFVVDGSVSLDELSERLGARLSHPEVTTVGGLVYSELGRVPRAGDQLTLEDFRIVVDRVDRRRVTRVVVERLPEADAARAGARE